MLTKVLLLKMSISNMVADSSSEWKLLPKFDQFGVVNWSKNLKVWLMRKNRNHLGLEDRPVRPANNAPVTVRNKYKEDLDKWLERKDTCISSIFEAVQPVAEALEIVDQYFREKDMLPQDHPDKEQLASELISRLIVRFRGEIQYELVELNKKFAGFKILPGELVCAAIDRLNGICQKMSELGEPPTDIAKKTKLQTALETRSDLEQLYTNLYLQGDITFIDMITICRRYDQAKGVPKEGTDEVNMNSTADENEVCSYPKCGKRGHSQKSCWKKKRDLKIAKLRRQGKSRGARNRSESRRDNNEKKKSDGCYVCGDTRHRAYKCKFRAQVRSDSAQGDKNRPFLDEKPAKRTDWNRFLRREEQEEDSDSVNMIMYEEPHDDSCVSEEVLHTSDEPVYLDSCASNKLFIVKDRNFLHTVKKEDGNIQTTRAGSSLHYEETGGFGDWTDIKICPGSVKNICSGGILRSHGYGLQLLNKPTVVRLDTGETVLEATYSSNGMPYVNLQEILDLPNLTMLEEVYLSDKVHEDPLEMLHKRCGHVSKHKLIEAFKHRLFTGSGLTRRHLSKKSLRKMKGICKACAKSKMTRKSFTAKRDDELQATEFLEKVSVDIAVYFNCPSRQGYKYVLTLSDIATKEFWEYPLETRSANEVLSCVKDWVERKLPTYPGSHRLIQYHSDGGAELIDKSIQQYLMSKFGTSITWSSTDSPEMNGVSERRNRTLGEMTLALLMDSGLPVIFWWDAYVYACMIVRRMPTRTYRGWMSPMECVPGGSVPDLSRFRRWGCKAYVLIPKGDRRKDWQEKSQTGYFIGLSNTKKGSRVWLGDKEVVSVHVLYDESIPPRDKEYYAELEEALVKTDPLDRSVEEFKHLIGSYHVDDGFLFKTTRVVVRKGLIVAFRALVTAGKEQIEEKVPIHVRDIAELTGDYNRRLYSKPRSCDDKRGGSSSTPASGDTPNKSTADEIPGKRMSLRTLPESSAGAVPSGVSANRVFENVPSCVPSENSGTVHAESRETSGKRTRIRRVLTNVSTLGEVNLLHDEEIVNLCDESDCALMSNSSTYREPETYEESLTCPEASNWKEARRLERNALFKREVFNVVETPPGVRPLKSRYVFKRKYNKDGSIKKHKARLVALGYGQRTGIDVENTFAPVVKSITVRLIIALAFMFSMHIHQLDVSNAFCYAKIEGDVYMDPPPDFQLPPGHCFKLYRSLYGLRSSPRSWWKTIHGFIKSLGFKPCILEPCLYYMMYKGHRVYLTIYVDDIVIACADLTILTEIKKRFCERFDMSDMGELEHFLNVRVTRTKNYIQLDQSTYAEKILTKYAAFLGPSNKVRKSPLPVDAMDRINCTDSENSSQEEEGVDNYPYRSLLGAMLYLSMNTRPDIAYAVGLLSRYASKPTKATCKLMTYLLQYIRGTVRKGIRFSGKSFDMHIFTDADWAGDTVSRRSTTGYIVFAAGGPLTWQSILQVTVSTSSMQSEYQAMYAGMQELVWLRGVLAELGLRLYEPTPFFLDSQSARDLALNPVFHKRSKHIEIKYHWVREHVDPEGRFNTAILYHVGTDNQTADIFTKSLCGVIYEKHRKRCLGEDQKSSVDVIRENSYKRNRGS